MEGRKRRKYDKQFKLEAARLVVDQGQSCRSVEDALGLPHGLVKDWVRIYKTAPQAAFPGNGRKRAHQSRIQTLEREIDLLCRQRDILKKALAIFSTDPLRYMDS